MAWPNWEGALSIFACQQASDMDGSMLLEVVSPVNSDFCRLAHTTGGWGWVGGMSGLGEWC